MLEHEGHAKVLAAELRAAGFEVRSTADAEQRWGAGAVERPHVVVLAVMPGAPVLVNAYLRIDLLSQQAWLGGLELPLTAIEYRLLVHLASNLGSVCSRRELLTKVWRLPPGLRTRTVDNSVKRLRRKLGGLASGIETVRGAGYRMTSPELEPALRPAV
jgi:DNA-binding response OmpR family regulator